MSLKVIPKPANNIIGNDIAEPTKVPLTTFSNDPTSNPKLCAIIHIKKPNPVNVAKRHNSQGCAVNV